MQQFIEKYGDDILGVLSGSDRIVFRGTLPRLYYGHWNQELNAMVADGMGEYLWQNDIRFKDYHDHVKKISAELKGQVRELWSGVRYIYETNPGTDKDQLARQVAEQEGIHSGPVCLISSMEPSPTFEHRGKYMIRRIRPSHVLYQYQSHPQLGWMHARIQTWFPFNIQIALNGREWLARQMDQVGLSYHKQDNCFPWVEDWKRAQALFDEQLKTNWTELLGSFGKQLNPIREKVFEKYPTDYYWTCHQSEWATDVVFRDPEKLKWLKERLVRHGILSFHSTDVMRFLARKVNQSGEIPARFQAEVRSDFKRREEGERVRYGLDGNSIKFYDKAYTSFGNVLRVAETTINNAKGFRVYRPKQGGPEDVLQWLQMRKGTADLYRRAEVSQSANERLMDALASVDDSRSVEELTGAIQQPVSWAGRRVRALRPWGEDKPWLDAINHGDFLVNGFRNRDLQKLLYDAETTDPREARRRSARVSRYLRMLRAHKLIQKVPHTHRYHVTASGRTILVAVLTTARTTLLQLNQLDKVA